MTHRGVVAHFKMSKCEDGAPMFHANHAPGKSARVSVRPNDAPRSLHPLFQVSSISLRRPCSPCTLITQIHFSDLLLWRTTASGAERSEGLAEGASIDGADEGVHCIKSPPIGSQGNVSLRSAPKAFQQRWFICWACDRRGPRGPLNLKETFPYAYTPVLPRSGFGKWVCVTALNRTRHQKTRNPATAHTFSCDNNKLSTQTNALPSMVIDKMAYLCSALSHTSHNTAA